MALTATICYEEEEEGLLMSSYHKGVRHLQERGITKVPVMYILPLSERPNFQETNAVVRAGASTSHNPVELPVIDFSHFYGPNRSQVLASLAEACQHYGFFQLVNHNIPKIVIDRMVRECRDFFELPFEERSKYMTPDMRANVRYGTSFSQTTDKVFCWRDFLKLNCHSLPDALLSWPSLPPDLREAGVSYSKKTKALYLELMKAILESLGVVEERDDELLSGNHMIVANCYPVCPEPDLTLAMQPHSDFGFLTLLLQDEQIEGLQIHHDGRWVSVAPTPANSYIINVGDHLEIFSNGRYKSVLHRVIANRSSTRYSLASLYSLPHESTVQPSPRLIDENNPRRYKDTTFTDFLEFITSREHKGKIFLESRKF